MSRLVHPFLPRQYILVFGHCVGMPVEDILEETRLFEGATAVGFAELAGLSLSEALEWELRDDVMNGAADVTAAGVLEGLWLRWDSSVSHVIR